MAVSNSDVRHENTPMSVTGMPRVGRNMSAEWETLETPIPLGSNTTAVCGADGSTQKQNSYKIACNEFGNRTAISETQHLSRNDHCKTQLEKDKEISILSQEDEKGKEITDLCDEHVHEETKSRATYSVKGQTEGKVNEEHEKEVNDTLTDDTANLGAAMYVSTQPLQSQPSAADLAAEFEMHARKSQSRHTLNKLMAGEQRKECSAANKLPEDKVDKNSQPESTHVENGDISKDSMFPESSTISNESSDRGSNKGSMIRDSSTASHNSAASNNHRQINSSAASNSSRKSNSSAASTVSRKPISSAVPNSSTKPNSSASKDKPSSSAGMDKSTKPNCSPDMDNTTQQNSPASLNKPTYSKELAPYTLKVSPNKTRTVPLKISPPSHIARQTGKKTGSKKDELDTGTQCTEHPDDVHSFPEPEVAANESLSARRERYQRAEMGYDNGVQQKALLELMIKGLGNFTTTMADVMLGKLRPEYEVLARQVGREVKEETTAELKALREKVTTSEKTMEKLSKEKTMMKSEIEKEREEMKKEIARDYLKRLKEIETKDATIDKLEKDLEKVQTQLKDKEKSTRKAEHKAKSEEHKRVKLEEEYQAKFKEMQTQLNKAKSDLLVLKSKRRLQTTCGRRPDDTGTAKLISHHGMYPRHMTHPKNVPYVEGDD